MRNSGLIEELAQESKDKRLWRALETESFYEAQRAFDLGANLNSEGVTNGGREAWSSPLIWAAINGEAQTCAWLIQRGADIELATEAGERPLLFASLFGHADCVEALLNAGAEVEAKDEGRRSALHGAAQNNMSCVNLLVNAGALLEEMDEMIGTPLHHAALEGKLSVCVGLLELGADAMAKNESGYTPAELALGNQWKTEGDVFQERKQCAGAIEAFVEARELEGEARLGAKSKASKIAL